MNKAYSNKALPAGTVLREWRLEEVLGVGGFGIVYKGRGIYFNELVAIKEYFPSSISERDSADTVVPIDSDAEDVHALGLKKFVEEAKLLWNLSTPSRHPNIVSVRSLFEIHGTAYMVMDFEDGTSLSKMIKQGRRFNERSLWNILQPIAEGLDRAHRVGVLHRDIKPPNILINEDNRPVLIDFGSARFTTAEATSATVTFHTPPYAAIEQYVKTYDQGPWTDVYALGVVMYECVTGEKPPEVLERLHAGLGKPLAEGKWPGYTKRFLAAIDAAMTVKPEDRPQSISDWLSMFGKKAGEAAGAAEADEDATRFIAQQVETEAIVPVAPTPDFDPKALAVDVPADPKEAQFKRAGEETGAKKKPPKPAPDEPVESAEEESTPTRRRVVSQSPAEDAGVAATAPARPTKSTIKKPALVAGAAALVLVAAGAGALMLTGRSAQPEATAVGAGPDGSELAVGADASAALGDPAAATNDAEAANAAAAEVTQEATEDSAAADALRREAAKTAAAEARLAELKKAQARTAQAQAKSATAAASTPRPDRKSAAAAQTNTVESDSAGVSAAKLSQFYSIVDDARALAKKVMRSSNSQNAQLARSYDANLKTLRASMGGIRSDKEADRLIKQANQTRAYVQFLAKQ